MNLKQRIIFDYLFAGRIMRRSTNFDGKEIYKVFDDKVQPIAYITSTSLGKGRELLKRDKKGWYSLNLSIVRRQHGNTWIKKRYKSHKHEKSAIGKLPGYNRSGRKKATISDGEKP